MPATGSARAPPSSCCARWSRNSLRNGHALVDALPVAGIDAGTLHARLDGPGESGHVVGKSGTFGDYGASALIGAISTTDLGTVYFAILNHAVPVPQARARQERFLRALLGRLHSVPWNYQPDTRPAIARAQATLAAAPTPAAPAAPAPRAEAAACAQLRCGEQLRSVAGRDHHRSRQSI